MRKWQLELVGAGPTSVGHGGAAGGGSGGMGGGGSACDLAAPTPLVTGVAAMPSIAVDAEFVYYASDQGSQVVVYVESKAGGTPTALASLPAGSSADLAADDANVYVLQGSSATGGGGLRIIAKPTFSARFIAAQPICGVAHPQHLAVFGGEVYWTQRDTVTADCDGGIEIDHLPLGTTTPVRFTAADETAIGGIFVDAAHLFWSDPRGTMRASRDGTTGDRLDPRQGGILASDGNTLFFSPGRTVWAVTAPYVDHVAYEDPSADIRGLVADSAHVLIAGSHLLRLDVASGAITLVSDAPAAGPVAVDDRYAYYFDGSEILKACR